MVGIIIIVLVNKIDETSSNFGWGYLPLRKSYNALFCQLFVNIWGDCVLYPYLDNRSRKRKNQPLPIFFVFLLKRKIYIYIYIYIWKKIMDNNPTICEEKLTTNNPNRK